MFSRIITFFTKAPITVAAPVPAPATGESLLWAVSRGALLLSIQNAGFAGDPQSCRDSVFAALRSQLASRPVVFTDDPAQAGDPAYHLILAFAPAAGLSATQLAQGQFRPRPPEPGLHLLLALCHEDQALTWVEGRLGACDGIDDPAFAKLIRQSFRDLLRLLPP